MRRLFRHIQFRRFFGSFISSFCLFILYRKNDEKLIGFLEKIKSVGELNNDYKFSDFAGKFVEYLSEQSGNLDYNPDFVRKIFRSFDNFEENNVALSALSNIIIDKSDYGSLVTLLIEMLNSNSANLKNLSTDLLSDARVNYKKEIANREYGVTKLGLDGINSLLNDIDKDILNGKIGKEAYDFVKENKKDCNSSDARKKRKLNNYLNQLMRKSEKSKFDKIDTIEKLIEFSAFISQKDQNEGLRLAEACLIKQNSFSERDYIIAGACLLLPALVLFLIEKFRTSGIDVKAKNAISRFNNRNDNNGIGESLEKKDLPDK